MTCLILLKGSTERGMETICAHERYTVEEYVKELIKRDLASRKEAGWTVKRGWASKMDVEQERAASFKKTPPRKKVTSAS